MTVTAPQPQQTHTGPPPTSTWPSGASNLRVPVVALVIAGISLIFLLLFYGESRYRSCIAKAEAQYPAVAVSSFNQRTTGPLKVSFVNERNRALEACSRF